ncbi:hypothetical protein B0H19DRAFT_1076036 [Mycena capillaripes]|nr:hypothetical protein B0H19DRAFT_1076036 [Mycena capillaripes]
MFHPPASYSPGNPLSDPWAMPHSEPPVTPTEQNTPPAPPAAPARPRPQTAFDVHRTRTAMAIHQHAYPLHAHAIQQQYTSHPEYQYHPAYALPQYGPPPPPRPPVPPAPAPYETPPSALPSLFRGEPYHHPPFRQLPLPPASLQQQPLNVFHDSASGHVADVSPVPKVFQLSTTVWADADKLALERGNWLPWAQKLGEQLGLVPGAWRFITRDNPCPCFQLYPAHYRAWVDTEGRFFF